MRGEEVPGSDPGRAGVGLAVAAVAFSVYAFGAGFAGWLPRDPALYHLAGLELLEGHPSYTTVFDIKTPLSAIVAAAGIAGARLFGLAELQGVRILFALFAASASAAIYLLVCRLRCGPLPALLAALGPLTLLPWVADVAMGPRPKVLAASFLAWALAESARDQWDRCGLAIGLGALTYQPVGLVGAALLAGGLLPPCDRRREVLRAFVAGAMLPWAAFVAYAMLTGSLPDFLTGSFGIHLSHMVDRAETNPIVGLLRIAGSVGALPLWFLLWGGAVGFVVAALNRTRSGPEGERRWWRAASVAGLAAFGWSLLDFQVPADVHHLVPFALVGAAWLVAPWLERSLPGWSDVGGVELRFLLLATGVIFSAGVVALQVRSARPDLVEQRATVREIQELARDAGRPVAIGAPQVLAYTRWSNPTRYPLLDPGIDRFIADRHPGGFPGWLDETLCGDTDFLVWGGAIPVFRDVPSPWVERFGAAVRRNYARVRTYPEWCEQELSVWRRQTEECVISER